MLNAGFQSTGSRVQEMHRAIASKAFTPLLRIPGLSAPTRLVQSLHDAIVDGVYAGVRHGGTAVFSAAGQIERMTSDPVRVPGLRERSLRNAVNGAFGDALRASGSGLAIEMGLHADGGPLAPTPAALRRLRPRVAVFVHGLACDEHSWARRDDAWSGSHWAPPPGATAPIQYGTLLEREFDLSAVYLRYNTGLGLEQNALEFAALLERAAAAAPQVREWLPIGHSMGGLVARRAHAIAAASGLAWAPLAPMIVCLGSPHQGAPLEVLGQVATAALNVAAVSRPIGGLIASRSRGIQDLRTGLKGMPGAASPPALRLVSGSLMNVGADGSVPLLGRLLGDGLVTSDSASDDGAEGDVERVALPGIGHMALLNHPRVYAVLRRWLGAAALSDSPNDAPCG